MTLYDASFELLGPLQVAVEQGVRQLLPGLDLRLEPSSCDPNCPESGTVCLLTVCGPWSGTIAMMCSQASTKALATRLIAEAFGEDGASMQDIDESTLNEFEESALRELCNRVGAVLARELSRTRGFHEISFPVFFHGSKINIRKEYDREAALMVSFADVDVEFWLGLSPTAGDVATTKHCDSFAEMREQFLAELQR